MLCPTEHRLEGGCHCGVVRMVIVFGNTGCFNFRDDNVNKDESSQKWCPNALF